METKLFVWAAMNSCYSEVQFWGTRRRVFLNQVKPQALEQLEAFCFLVWPGTGSLRGRSVLRPGFSLSLGLSSSSREDWARVTVYQSKTTQETEWTLYTGIGGLFHFSHVKNSKSLKWVYMEVVTENKQLFMIDCHHISATQASLLLLPGIVLLGREMSRWCKFICGFGMKAFFFK